MMEEIITAALTFLSIATGIGALSSSLMSLRQSRKRAKTSDELLRGLEALELAAVEEGWDEHTKLRLLKEALVTGDSELIMRYSTDDWRNLATG